MKLTRTLNGCFVATLVALGTFSDIKHANGIPQNQAAVEEGVQVLTRGPVHEAFAETISFDPEPGIIVPNQPPEAIEEIAPEQRPEGDTVAWIPGYPAWDDERDDFHWVSGIWRDLPPGRQWMPGYWTEVESGYHHYYFGDYYANNFSTGGYYPWFSYGSSGYGYDPFYARQRWDNRELTGLDGQDGRRRQAHLPLCRAPWPTRSPALSRSHHRAP